MENKKIKQNYEKIRSFTPEKQHGVTKSCIDILEIMNIQQQLHDYQGCNDLNQSDLDELAAADKHIEKIFRSPTLETVKMVERIIKDNSGEFKKTQIWEKLPRKIMWPTYLTILDYLKDLNKIIIGEDGIITYIWNPILLKKVLHRKHY